MRYPGHSRRLGGQAAPTRPRQPGPDGAARGPQPSRNRWIAGRWGWPVREVNDSFAINVSEVARLLECNRAKLYNLSGFMALVKQDGASRGSREESSMPSQKDKRTRTVEAWRDDD